MKQGKSEEQEIRGIQVSTHSESIIILTSLSHCFKGPGGGGGAQHLFVPRSESDIPPGARN
jgi:hypothetical protein